MPAAAEGLGQAAAALHAFCAGHSVPPEIGWRLKVALDEALSNVLRHGEKTGPEAMVGLSLRISAGVMEMTMTDEGPAFNPLKAPDPDLTAPLETRAPGGVGIVLIKALVDEVAYDYREGRNVLVMRMRLADRRRAGL